MKILPSLKQLEYLVALDEEKHFGRAADCCNVTPSTVSAGIRDLEVLLGSALAERTNRSVMMTPFGQEVAGKARSLLRSGEEIMELASARKREPLTGALHMGVIPTIGPFFLPSVLPDMWRKHPELQLFLREEQTEPLLDKLRRGVIDVALIALPYSLEELDVQILFDDYFQFACSDTHPFAQMASISQEKLDREPLLLLAEGHCLRGHLLEVCKLEQHQNHTEFAATSVFTLVQMVAANMGVTLLPELATESSVVRDARISLVPLEQPSARKIGLVWRKSTHRREEFEQLGKALVPRFSKV
ncbi:hydrogen peroxide-inducible genes activator [Sneathiella sp.]|jgi:LysR family hydrogen peroxide-inducible transcriptional activator|uniref:hydrogen peroxide-inducible genes activator n=1 Tax=Sneathiella sp. TaxID=1964365 RepID=UPI0039E38FEA